MERYTHKALAYIVLTLLSVCFSLDSHAQDNLRRARLDTLKLKERISIHTNSVDWLMLMPNIGVEFDIRSTNWNKWAVGLDLKSKWSDNNKFAKKRFYYITEGRMYVRNYWRTRQTNKPKAGLINRLLKFDSRTVKHPNTIYYIGLYGSVADYSIKFGDTGHQGIALSGGLSGGIIKQLYTFRRSGSLDLDLGVDVGLVCTHSESFTLSEDDNCYTRLSPRELKIKPYPLPTALRAAFIYRFGNYPSGHKYRWRIDVDQDYIAKINDLQAKENVRQIELKNKQENLQKMRGSFWHMYDSLSTIIPNTPAPVAKPKATPAASPAKDKKAKAQEEEPNAPKVKKAKKAKAPKADTPEEPNAPKVKKAKKAKAPKADTPEEPKAPKVKKAKKAKEPKADTPEEPKAPKVKKAKKAKEPKADTPEEPKAKKAKAPKTKKAKNKKPEDTPAAARTGFSRGDAPYTACIMHMEEDGTAAAHEHHITLRKEAAQ